jgi:UDP-N-acetylmuramoyl-tripeptide--D-alanyl-D-alanine ligase
VIRLTVTQLADVVGGEAARPGDGQRVIDHVVTDSRQAGPGALFVALPGEHADGHAFVADAARRGASAALIAAERPLPDASGTVIVDDPADALLGLGAWVRDAIDPLVVAITGSQGKTSTKDLIAAAIGSQRAVVAAPASYNNDVGVPLTCCLAEPGTEVLVCEMGTRGLGDLARLAPVVRPDIAVVTAIGASHLALLGDVDTVARAKGELVEALAPDAHAVLNADDHRVAALATRTDATVVTYGVAQRAAWRARAVTLDGRARARFTAATAHGIEVPVTLGRAGHHMVANALAALAVADLAGVDAAHAAPALATAPASRWRMALAETPEGGVLLNDAYNANPASTRAALESLAALAVPGQRWAVLGDMAELGAHAAQAHRDVGELAAAVGLDGLVVIGEQAAAIADAAEEAGFAGATARLADADAALAWLDARVSARDAVLIKASRAVGLEAVADALGQRLGAEPSDAGGGP